MTSCEAGQIIGAVLGTFFGTLLLCVVLAVIFVVAYRRRSAQLPGSAARRNTAGDANKKQMSPSSVQAYTNAGFQEAETYEMRGTLAVRQPEVVRSSVVPFAKTANGGLQTTENGHTETLQESVVQLALGRQDGIGHGFEVRGGSADGLSGGIFISEVLQEASDLMKTVMTTGDEILSIAIEVKRELSVTDARSILRHAADCPVRLTLRRRRRPSTASSPVSTTVFQSDHVANPLTVSATAAANSCVDVAVVVDDTHDRIQRRRGSAGSKNSSDGDRFRTEVSRMSSSSGLTRWRSEPTTSVARSCDVDVSVADDVDGDAGGELLQVYPPYQGLAVEPLPERARSLTDVNIRESTSSPVTSSSQIRSTLSDDRLYADGPSSQARNRTRRDDAEIMEHSTDGSSSFTRVDVDSNGDVRDAKTRSIGGDSFDSLDFVNVGDEMTADSRTVERSRRSNDVATDDDDAIGSFVSIDGASVDYSDDDSLARALAAGRRVPNRAGLDKALRAKERASRGGMAYYVDLEPHFDRLPNQQERHSLDSQTADSVGIHKPTTAASDTSNR